MTIGLLTQAITIAFVIGAMALVVLTLVPSTKQVGRQLWPILASEALILTLGILPWMLPSMILLCVLMVVAGRIGFESGTVHGVTTQKNFATGHALVLLVVSLVSWLMDTPAFLIAWGLLLVFAFGVFRITTDRSVGASLAHFTIFPLLPLAAFSHAASQPKLVPLVVLAFFLVEIFDSFSLLGGRVYGRTPLARKLSPRKTVEGLATGAIATLVAALLLAIWAGLPILPMLLSAIIVAVTAFAGDLLGSLAKRKAGIKDYPAVMSVQGGLLDIIDAWLVAGPSLVAVAYVLKW